MTRKGNIILLVLWIVALLWVILYFVLKQVDRSNWYYGMYTLNFETREIKADVDEYVLQHNGTAPITVGINLAGINQDNIKQVKRFYTDYNRTQMNTEYSSGIDGTHLFAIPRIWGEYSVWAEISYNDGRIVKSSNYFTGPNITIWTDVNNPLLPIASLRSDKTKVSLQEEIIFDVSTKINTGDQTEFLRDKQVLRDFDGDGTRDRTSQGTRAIYRYLNSNSEGKYKPKIAVVYKWFTGSTEGAVTIR